MTTLLDNPIIYTGIALVVLTWVGNLACRLLFYATGMKAVVPGTAGNAQPAGYIIGWLERIIIAIGIIAQSWEILGAVIALKTVARFKELDDRLPAEYFLVGSLFSLLWAIIITGSWMFYDDRVGNGVYRMVSKMLEPPTTEGNSTAAPLPMPSLCLPWCPLPQPPNPQSLFSYSPIAVRPDRA